MHKREIPWLEPRENGVYYVYWYCPAADGGAGRTRRKTMGTRDAGEATARYAAFLTQGGTGADADVTVEDVLESYWAEHVSRNVVDAAGVGIAHRYLRAFFGDIAVKDIALSHSQGYRAARRAGTVVISPGRPTRPTLSDGTIRGELAALVAAINHAVKHRRLAPGDAPHIEMPSHSPPRERWLTKDEVARLLSTAARGNNGTLCRVYVFCQIAYWTAARKRAIETLRKDQVDLERGLIYLNPPGRAQTKKRRPVVPITSALRPALEQAMQESATDYVLGSALPIRRAFETLCVAAGFGDDVTPHTLRHSRGTHVAQDTGDLYVVCGLLGDSMATVERTYAHHCPDHLRQALEGSILGAESGARRPTGVESVS